MMRTMAPWIWIEGDALRQPADCGDMRPRLWNLLVLLAMALLWWLARG